MKKIHVYAPKKVVLVCGGQYKPITDAIKSLRHAFLNASPLPPYSKYSFITPEDLTSDPHFFEHFKDILSFERLVAEATSLILLFCESHGSVAELGAFSVIDEIAKKLMIVIEDSLYNSNSFIKYGPIRYLENQYGEKSSFVIKANDIGTKSTFIQKYLLYVLENETIDAKLLGEMLSEAFLSRAEEADSKTSFDHKIPGHILKFIVGIIEHYGSLTEDEIDVLLYSFGIEVETKQLQSFLYSALILNWIRKDKIGLKTYYTFALNAGYAVSFKSAQGIRYDKIEWKASVISYWEKFDQQRHKCILDARRVKM